MYQFKGNLRTIEVLILFYTYRKAYILIFRRNPKNGKGT